jgi:hypothetical protein
MKIFAKAQQAEAIRRTQVRINMKILFFKALLSTCACLAFNSKKCKGSFRDVWITSAFFRERFYRGGCTFTSFGV